MNFIKKHGMTVLLVVAVIALLKNITVQGEPLEDKLILN